MKYQFNCSNCNHDQEIEMKMSEYTGDGHKCEKCGSDLHRVFSAKATFIDTTGGFYKKVN